uniref:Uncharacterized protein TCIL3000_9_350 n=1 Tax=Trypanosoma congolense (strain IL3000) TaxID=1068625 RepID=G0UTC7_TRYCI|nr:unnamed protein product [Trypanosoma congolense IL3000]
MFSNGISPCIGTKAPHPLVRELTEMSDAALCKLVPCRQSDVCGVREALCIIGSFLARRDPDQVMWGSWVWQDAVKRVGLASSALRWRSDVTDLVTFALGNAAPCEPSPVQIVEGTIALLTSDITVSQLREYLATQSNRAKTCVRALLLLLRAKENFLPSDLFCVVRLLRDLMACQGDHYLLRFRGCGEVLLHQIRDLVHRLLTAMFKALQCVMSPLEGERRGLGPHRFLWDTDEFGPFALVTLSLLATPLDERDLNFIWHKIVSQVEELLPRFTDFSRTASFKVDEVEEDSVLRSMQALVSDSEFDGNGGSVIGSAEVGNGEEYDSFVGLTMNGANEFSMGVWIPTGEGRVCSTSTPLYSPSVQFSSLSPVETLSSPPLLASAVSSPRPAPSVSSPAHAASLPCVADISLVCSPSRALFIALASERHGKLTKSVIDDDPLGFYFNPQSGQLHHGNRVYSMPPITHGDTLTICFLFLPKMTTRVLCFLVNGVRFASFPTPPQSLYLVVGVMDSSPLSRNTVRISFRLHKELDTLLSTRAVPTTACSGVGEAIFSGDGLPTRSFISMFATFMFAYLVSLCTRRLAQVRRTVSGSSTATTTPLRVIAGSTTSFQSEEAWGSFIDGCCDRLRHNVESLIESTRHLSLLDGISDATERVKRCAAFFVYHRFLMDYITIMRTAIYCSSRPVDILSTLAKVVCCEEAGERAQCAALTSIYTVLLEPSANFDAYVFNPMQLWDCCCSLSRHTTAPGYKALFTPESTARELRVVSGGSHILSAAPGGCNSRATQNTVSFASQGIPLDGSLGDVISFSVRIKRGFDFDSLGRFYYIGVACPNPSSTKTTLERIPKSREEMKYVYAITDYFTDMEPSSACVELPRHSKHWMNSQEKIIFGSGDIITVTIYTKLRCVSFQRNGLTLGTLYTSIPQDVKVVFPFVEMYNKDACATWMYAPRELGIRARLVMRAMLVHWGPILITRLARMLEEKEVVALQVLGADGDELSFIYSGPPCSERKGLYKVRLIKQMGTAAEVVVEGERAGGSNDSGGAFTVPSVALEPNYSSVISNNLPLKLVVEEIARIISRCISFTTDEIDGEVVHIRSTKVFMCAVRLLSELEVDDVVLASIEAHRTLLNDFLRILAVSDVVPLDGPRVVLDAWNELMLLPDDDELRMTLSPEAVSLGNICDENYWGVTSSGVESNDEGEEIICLRCPACDKEWSSCTETDHAAPYSLCSTLHNVMQRLSLPSPFVGFACGWVLEEKSFRLNLRAVSRDEIEGDGSDSRGVFSFTGTYVSSHCVRGRCVYKFVENPNTAKRCDEEWTCSVCTFINLSDSTRCAMCTTARPGATWSCLLCSYAFNSINSKICTTCGHLRLGSGAAEAAADGSSKQTFCTDCGNIREYTKFSTFEAHHFCDKCQREVLWLPEDRHVGVVEARLAGAGDRMTWLLTFGSEKCFYSNIKSTDYSFEEMLGAVSAVSASESNLSRYVPPLVHPRLSSEEGHSDFSVEGAGSAQDSQKLVREYRAVIPAVLLFCSRVVCRWAPVLAPQELTKSSILCRLRVLEDSWLTQFEKVPIGVARRILSSCLRILLDGQRNGRVVWSLSSVARAIINCNPLLQQQRHYLLYALSLNVARRGADREFRELCYAALNMLLEDSCGQSLKVQCLQEVIAVTPFVAKQQQLMVHASLRGINTEISAEVTLTSWLIDVVERMERGQSLPTTFNNTSPDTFPHIVELPDTRMGSGGELVVGQVRGSVGVFGNKGGHYYYEVVLPPNFDDRSKTIVMGWGTIQHEVVSSGQHVGSDFHSWGFNCQDRLRILSGEQALVTPRPIVGGDVVGTLLDLDTMMMCWSVNGEELMWIPVSTDGKGEAIYPYVSASMEPYGVLVRLSYTQFKPEGYKDFSPVWSGDLIPEDKVKPQSLDFYRQLCCLVNNVVNTGFTVDSLSETTTWMEEALASLHNYPLLSSEIHDGSLQQLQPYLQHLRSINALAVSVAKSHSIFRTSPLLMRSYEKARQLLFFAARWAIVERQIDRGLLRNNVKRNCQVSISLSAAKNVPTRGGSFDFVTLFNSSITGQLFRQTHEVDIYRDAVMFVTRLTDEVADDAGGVTRSVVSMMCDELSYRDDDGGSRVDPLLPFFKLSNHSTIVNLVPNIDFYRNNPDHRKLFIQFFTWFGKLIGNVTLSGYVLFSITLPRLVWMFLTFGEPTVDDYYFDIDDTVRGAVSDDEFLLNDEFYNSIPVINSRPEANSDAVSGACSGCHWDSAVLRSNADGTTTAFGRPPDFDESAEAGRRRVEVERRLVHQYDELLLAMRSGVSSVIPPHCLQLIRWDDLQQRVCGSPCASAEDVMSSLDVSLLSQGILDMLTEVVRGLSNKQRAQFLLFCSGQRRVPLPERVKVLCGDDPSAFPTAHTCSPISLHLQPYSSAAIMREKLEVSIHHMYEFGFV